MICNVLRGAVLGFVALSGVNLAHASPLPYPAKWSQLPDMNQGTDYLSMHRANGPVVVDDWRSDGREILGFHWWGSYFDPTVEPEQGQSRQVLFELSFHPDCPANADCNGDGTADYAYSTPGQPYEYVILEAEEDYYGTTAGGERVYEYWVPFKRQEVAGTIYWLDVAWSAGQFGTDPEASIWGWHESFEHNLDNAVTTNCNIAPNCPGGNPHLGGWTLLEGRDMAFEILVPEPGSLALLSLGLAGLGLGRRRKA
jgi:hypothetical protein